MKPNQINSVYFLLLATNILAGILNIDWLLYCSKPLLMPILIFIVYSECQSSKLRTSLIVALVFSLLGDIFLLSKQEDFFLYGLAAFLLAQLTYIFIFKRTAKLSPLRMLPFLFFIGLMCFGVLWGKLSDDMAIPVYVYMLVIMCMGIFSTMRKTNSKSFEWVLVGAVLFIVSDSFIAVQNFVKPMPYAIFWVMSTYGIAQYLIVRGLLIQEVKSK